LQQKGYVMAFETDYKPEGRTSNERLQKRKNLYRLFKNRPMPDDQLMVNLGLFMRSSALTKILYINELYQHIIDIPGVIVEFGTWWGQNLVLFENLRAIYEPFNYERRIIGFDTFKGYSGISKNDKKSETVKEGGYCVSNDSEKYLQELLDYHEQENVLYFNRKHQLIKGDVRETVELFFNKEPHVIIALAYLDLALYEPTKRCLKEILPHLIKGSIIAIDGFNSSDYPGETLAVKEILDIKKYKICKSKFMPGRSYAIVE